MTKSARERRVIDPPDHLLGSDTSTTTVATTAANFTNVE